METYNNQTASNAAIHAGEHELRETLTLECWYPDHPPRTESALFARTKHHLIHVLDTPCWICGSRESREVHHAYVEWAFSEAVDWEKVKADHPGFDWSTFTAAEDFIDSAYQMRVLCAEHHRGKDRGVHMIPQPVWIIQKYVKDGFRLF